MAMPNPADGLKEVAKELQEKFEEAGMGAVDAFVDTLDEIKDKAADGPKKIMDATKNQFEAFKKKVEDLANDPSSLAPTGGAVALMAKWYCNAVAQKLGALKDMIEDLVKQLVDMASKIAEPMGNVGTVIGAAMASLEKTLKKLSKLPAEVGKMAKEIDSPDDIAKIDVAPMKACLNVSGFESPLNDIKGLNDGIAKAISLVKDGLAALEDFIKNAADHIRNAFNVPFPCCCCTGSALAQAPQAFTDMMDMVEKLKGVQLGDLSSLLQKTADAIGGIDVAVIKIPVNKFAESAAPSLDKLEKTVQGAKLASNPAGAIGGAAASFGIKSPF
jgi:archaellum component FlaC